jgi:hypothetical protein
VPKLSLRAVNRATLDRQLLLRRHALSAQQAVRHLAGLQAQAPLAPYVGLWTRLAGFDPEKISHQLSERTVVRAPIMRGTVHLVDAIDFVAFRPLFGPLLAGALRANYTRRLVGVDLAALVTEATALLSASPYTRAELAKVLAISWPDADPLRPPPPRPRITLTSVFRPSDHDFAHSVTIFLVDLPQLWMRRVCKADGRGQCDVRDRALRTGSPRFLT